MVSDEYFKISLSAIVVVILLSYKSSGNSWSNFLDTRKTKFC